MQFVALGLALAHGFNPFFIRASVYWFYVGFCLRFYVGFCFNPFFIRASVYCSCINLRLI